MPICPRCGEHGGQFVVTLIAEVSAGNCRQTDTFNCARCNMEWQSEHLPPESFHPFSTPDFELTAADVG